MGKKIVWNQRPLRQFNDIINFIAEDSPDNAIKVGEKILAKIKQLSLNPEIYAPDKYKKYNKNSSYRAFVV